MKGDVSITRHLMRVWSWCSLTWWKLTAAPQWEKGQAIVEYGLLASLISTAAVACVVLIGPNIEQLFAQVMYGLGLGLGGTDPSSVPSLFSGGKVWHCSSTSNGIHCR